MNEFVLARINVPRGAIHYVAKLPEDAGGEWAYHTDPSRMLRVSPEAAERFKADMIAAGATFAVIAAHDFKPVFQSPDWGMPVAG